MSDNPEGELITKEEAAGSLSASLASQHALHGMFGRVFERLGGEEFLYNWAEENETRFISLMVGMTPSVQPTSGVQGDVHLHVHQTLTPTALDG